MSIWLAALATYLGVSAVAAWRLLYPGLRTSAALPPPELASETMTIDGVRVAVSVRVPDAGSPVCVLQHGLGQTRASWSGEAALLAQLGFGLVMMDLPGHGGSDRRATTYGAREARLLGGAIDRLGLAGRVTVLWGRSVGAAAVLQLAETLPAVKTLILECMFDSPLRAIARHAIGNARFRPLLPLLPGVLAVLWCVLLAHGALRFPLARIGSARVPVLLVTSTGDVGAPPSAQARLRARARHPDSRTVFVAEARHYECFARDAASFRSWLERHGAPPPAAGVSAGRQRQPA